MPMSLERKVRGVKRYANEPQSLTEEQVHHEAMLATDTDPQPSLRYADWLEEKGKPTHARIIREHVRNAHTEPSFHGLFLRRPAFSGLKIDSDEFRSSVGVGNDGKVIILKLPIGNKMRLFIGDSAVDPVDTLLSIKDEGTDINGATKSYFGKSEIVGNVLRVTDHPKMSRRIRRRYATEPQSLTEEQMHLQAMLHGGDDPLPALRYADWLEEKGKATHAKIVRDHVSYQIAHKNYGGFFPNGYIHPSGKHAKSVAGSIANNTGNLWAGFMVKIDGIPISLIGNVKDKYELGDVLGGLYSEGSAPADQFARAAIIYPGAKKLRRREHATYDQPGKAATHPEIKGKKIEKVLRHLVATHTPANAIHKLAKAALTNEPGVLPLLHKHLKEQGHPAAALDWAGAARRLAQ